MSKPLSAALLAASIIVASPAAAQLDGRSYDIGPFWNVSAIDVEDGHFEEYMTFLSGQWRRIQDFTRQQGWTLDYYVLANEYPRENEPDLYLVTRFRDHPSTEEARRRDAAINRFLEQSPMQQDQASGARSSMRTLGGVMLLREMTFGR